VIPACRERRAVVDPPLAPGLRHFRECDLTSERQLNDCERAVQLDSALSENSGNVTMRDT
jgi:hypothetical protein